MTATANRNHFRFSLFVALLLAGLLSLPLSLWATPSASFLYQESSLGPGIWEYDYVLSNTSDPIADAGYDIFEVFVTFDASQTTAILTLPGGWDGTSGSGFLEATSLNPGEPRVGTDVAPAASLNGFSFLFTFQAGNLPFSATLTDPTDPSNSFSFDGMTAPLATSIPEPTTMILLVSGIGGLWYMRRMSLKAFFGSA